MTKVLIIGLGDMGQSHALAHHMNPNSEIVGLVNRTERGLPDALKGYPRFNRVDAGMAQMPELVVLLKNKLGSYLELVDAERPENTESWVRAGQGGKTRTRLFERYKQ